MKSIIITLLLTLSSVTFSLAQQYQGLYIIDSKTQLPVMYIGAMTEEEHFSVDHQSLHFDREITSTDIEKHANGIINMLEQFHFEIVEDRNGTVSYYSFESDEYHIEPRTWTPSLTLND